MFLADATNDQNKMRLIYILVLFTLIELRNFKRFQKGGTSKRVTREAAIIVKESPASNVGLPQ